MSYGYGGIWGLFILIADVCAVVAILHSNATTEKKVLWTVLVVLLPVLGFILWAFFGPRAD